MIIVEGPDGAGKTTLVHELMDRYHGLRVGERGTEDRSKLYTVTRQDTYSALSKAMLGNEPMRIWDRLYYSELVYYDITGRHCEFSPQEQSFVERIINALSCPVILCIPPLDIVIEEIRKEKQMTGVIENVRVIWDRYLSLYQNSRFPRGTVTYDWSSGAARQGLDIIFAHIEHYRMERRARSWV